jgi:polar amino acid transport system substrate-binding protein
MGPIVNILAQNYKMTVPGVVGIVTLWILSLLPINTLAQDISVTPKKMAVGLTESPPFVMKTTDGRWEGLSIELWQAIAQKLGVEFELREYSVEQLLDKIKRGEVDVIPALAATERHEIMMDLSFPYLRSGLAIAVPAEASGHIRLHFAKLLILYDILPAFGLLLLLSLIAGTIVWLFEARRNREMFGGGTLRGVSSGIWWAMVTLTTVGYGDKAPKTFGGRMVALIWMFASVILIAILTAAITTSFTVSELKGKVHGLNDLPRVRVGCVAQSEGQNFLVKHGIAALPFGNEKDGLQAIIDKTIDAFVFDEAVLKYLARTEFPTRVNVLAGTFDHYYVSMGMLNDSPLREPFNRALLSFMKKDEWNRLVERYIGSGQ